MPEGRPSQINDRKVERTSILIYTVHQISMLGIAVYKHWPVWILFMFGLIILLEWGLYYLKYGNSHARQVTYACVMQVQFIIFSVHSKDFTFIMIPFASVVVMLGLTAYEDLIQITVLSFVILIIYHGFVLHTISFATLDEGMKNGVPIANVITIQSVILFWMKKRNESMQRMGQVISNLRMAERSKDDFLANVSHEIRTPINTINGVSEVLLQQELSEPVKEHVISIQNAGRNLVTVVSDILDFSELQSGKMEIAEENYNITSTINDIINMSMAQKNQKNIELVVDCDPNLPRGLLGDEKKIRRVILNLVNNAIKFTDEGGVSIEISSRKEFYGINLIITVRDSGIGMSAESVAKLFTSYNQVDTSKSRQKGGVGLGLAISKAIIQGMGGVITVRSKLGKGTSVRVTIPQKVVDERPIVELANKEKINILVYTNMERFKMRDVRDGYSKVFMNIGQSLNVQNHICRNFDEVKRRAEREAYSHVFIGYDDYQENPSFYDNLSKKMRVALIIDEYNANEISNRDLTLLYKPFYVIPVVSVLNGNQNKQEINDRTHHQEFIAPNAKILIVDDNVMNIRVAQGLLSKYQIKTVQALSGMEALEKIETKDFDLVFMDHMMPEMDGIETFRRIREKGGNYYKNVPIAALTANAIAGAREMFMTEGFNDFVEKPVDNSVLERVLARLLPENKLIYIEKEKSEQILNESDVRSISVEKENLAVSSTDETNQEEVFAIGDLDVETGQMYCGGRESYLEILKEYARKKEDNWLPIEEMYAKEDWKNYTIAVHAVKSSMLAVGAKELSEQAKKLEFAGKEENYTYIHENHATMIAEYKRVIGEILESKYVQLVEESDNQVENLPILSDEEFEKKIMEFEDAMFDLDEQKMTEIVTELSGYAFYGVALASQLSGVSHKIEMSDYMAASEVIAKVKDKLQKNRKEGE